MAPKTAASIFRDYEVDNVPSSGPHKPLKSEIRAWGAAIDNLVGAILPTDGSDIAPSINAALAIAQAAGGATVSLPPGSYTLQSQVFLNLWSVAGVLTVPGLRIQGAGRQATIIDTKLANDYAIAINPDWRKAFQALYTITTSAGGSLGTGGGIATLGAITAGSAYTNGSYTNVPLTGGSGSGATANITVAGGVVTVVTLVAAGSGYNAGNVLSAAAATIGGTGSGFSIPVTAINYFLQITMNDPLGNEIFVTLPKSIAVAASGEIAVVLPATNAGYSYNLYCDATVSGQPAHYGQLSGGADAKTVAGGQTVQIQAVGSAQVVPISKIAIWQEAYVADLSITNSTSVANASGLLLFKAGFSVVEDVYFKGLSADGIHIPDYTGDLDGSFNIDIHRCKFDSIAGWGINAAGAVLELSSLTIDFCEFNLCGTSPSNLNVAVTVSSIPNSASPVVGTSTAHNFKSGDQIAFSVAGITLAAAYYRVGSTVTSTSFNLVDLNGNAVDTTSLGAFTSGTVKLAWRPPVWDPVALRPSGSGGIAWLGLIGTLKNTNFTQCKNVAFYAAENGSNDNLRVEQVDFENTTGKGLYIGGLIGGRWVGGELLTATASGAMIGGVQLGTGMAAGGVYNLTIDAIKVRSDVTPCTAFEQFQNTNIGAAYADAVRVRNIAWQVFDAAGQTRFDGFKFDPIAGTAPFSISATNTAKLSQGFLPVKLAKTGEWVNYHVPAAGLTRGSIGGLTANTRYYFYVQNSAVAQFPIAPAILAPSTTAPVFDAEGYQVLPTDSSQIYIGTAITDGSGNFQTGAMLVSAYGNSSATPAVSSFAYQRVVARGVNFNAGNTDTQISIPLPAGYTRYLISQIYINNASHSLTTATFGVFSAAAAGGTAVVASGTACTVSATGAESANNVQANSLTATGQTALDFANLFFRVQTAEGAAATADVTITYLPLS